MDPVTVVDPVAAVVMFACIVMVGWVRVVLIVVRIVGDRVRMAYGLAPHLLFLVQFLPYSTSSFMSFQLPYAYW